MGGLNEQRCEVKQKSRYQQQTEYFRLLCEVMIYFSHSSIIEKLSW